MYMYFDPTYILVIIGAVISGIASFKVRTTFNRYSRVGNYNGYTAEQVAYMILQSAGINDVSIDRVRGDLTDHYSQTEKVLRLSESVYGSRSVAAIGVAAHECGHAIQDKESYVPLKLRAASVPLANIGSWVSWPLILIGLFFGSAGLAEAGVIFFTFVVAFQLITLPVEFDASKRAMAVLEERNILIGEELDEAGDVLHAAAMTYVAALFTAILQLLRLVILVSGSGGNDRGGRRAR